MKNETKRYLNELIIGFINKWLKQGTIIKQSWPFFARGELESLTLEAYRRGRADERRDLELEQAINRFI